MKIGVPKEIKNNEFRVAITPNGTKKIIENKHTVIIEKNAGINSSFLIKTMKMLVQLLQKIIRKYIKILI